VTNNFEMPLKQMFDTANLNSGLGAFTSGLAKAIRVGVLGKCGDSPPEVAVAINEIAVGKLDSPVAFTETKLQTFSLKP
jgi:hypothetical protein